ncbi:MULTISPECIES: DUF4845 domain-containing protein [unclassified Pseudomonas]|uniref:DUF4845 domain-containing protein n=1 Tax=unclassified Pseudomonas TaxID=196821 RepID=UPI000BC4D04C|nr:MULTISPECIES: DUF4845 domain-containing protein [unclassified Pseudomonas]PVZ16088.1 uncharacterized protein DUF4845 [Pseudomonas sp. URIL14HWK12:I12]PVZ26056.1 uncharacterized protein DUF4845 [Pseudomonas sp. URIL14HWK12:I10]PVZ36420.1 uncharacterized protein DUF4845 [Pseudomonas sp. URIL14HWK12:I11]SNZ18482.1 protein of unknown function [Pseudomonas sp. URIL14HWK12:I9]
MNSVARQQGLSLVGWLLALALLAFVFSIGLKVVPHYMDFWSLKKVMDNAGANKDERLDGPGDFIAHVQRGLTVNGISGLDLHQVLVVEEQGGVINAHLNYEKREHLAGNIDLVLVFKHDTSVTSQ